jgi:hypothetical protein
VIAGSLKKKNAEGRFLVALALQVTRHNRQPVLFGQAADAFIENRPHFVPERPRGRARRSAMRPGEVEQLPSTAAHGHHFKPHAVAAARRALSALPAVRSARRA